MTKFKIVVAGPKGTGKTIISNHLAGVSSNNSNSEQLLVTNKYDPTAGVRILEIELKLSGLTYSEDCNIEIWDSSGDTKYEACWRAIMAEADGIVLIYNPDAPAQDQQINDWFDFFVKKNGLRDEQCMIFAHRTGESTERFRPPPLFSRVNAALTGPQSGADVKSMFENFLSELFTLKQRK